MNQNVSELNSKHHFGAINGPKTSKIHFLEPKMTQFCSKESTIQTPDATGAKFNPLGAARPKRPHLFWGAFRPPDPPETVKGLRPLNNPPRRLHPARRMQSA